MPIILKPLTALQVKTATANDSPLRDGEGLFLKVTNANKIWRFDYQKPFTKKRTSIKLGNYPEMSLAEARELRTQYRNLLAKNIDPQDFLLQQEIEQLDKQQNTLVAVANRWRVNFKEKIVMSATMHEDWRRLENHIFPVIGKLAITDINSKLLIDTLQPLYKKGHTNALEKTLRLVVDIMDYAENTGLIEMHNCHKANKAFHFRAATHNPTINPKQLPKLIDDIYNANIKVKTKFLIFWSLFTGVRPAEAVSVEWQEIDWINKIWHIPAAKMKGRRTEKKPHNVPLSTQAIELLNALRIFSCESRFVFQHFKNADAPMSSETVNTALKRNGYKDVLTSHGIRSIIRTFLADKGVEKNTAERVLAHKIRDELEGTYNRHDYLEQRIPVMQLWADYVQECGFDINKIK